MNKKWIILSVLMFTKISFVYASSVQHHQQTKISYEEESIGDEDSYEEENIDEE